MSVSNTVFFSPGEDTPGIGNAEDIIQSNNDGTFSVFFDGSSLGLSGVNIDAFDIVSSTEILMSLSEELTLDGIGLVDDSNVVQFTATSLGENTTAGKFSLFLDGSDIGLTKGGENIDALTRMADGSLLISTSNKASFSNGLQTDDEDLVHYNPTTGDTSLYFDGSGVGLGDRRSEDINAITVNGVQILLSTQGAFSAAGTFGGSISGKNSDVFSFTPTTTGPNTEGSYSTTLFFDGSEVGFTGNISALDINQAPEITSDGGGATATINFAENQIEVTDVETSYDIDSEALVETFTRNGLYETVEVVGESELERKEDEIEIEIETSALVPGGVYSFWWVLLNDPENGSGLSVLWATGAIADEDGEIEVEVELKVGPEGIEGNPMVGSVYDFLVGDGLTNPFGARVEIQIVYHGQEEEAPKAELNDWLTTFWIGDPTVCNLPFIEGFPLICPIAQITVH